MKIKIGIITHKEFDFFEDDILIPLHVGKKGKKDLGYLGDDTGENISNKNQNYCELTGQYWMWKNWEDADYIGLFHYRRYMIKPSLVNDFLFFQKLFFEKISGFLKGKKVWVERKKSIKSNSKLFSHLKNTKKFILEEVPKNDVVLLREFSLQRNLRELYNEALVSEDLLTLGQVIKEIYPDYYDSFEKLINQNKLSPCNMFIAKREIFDNYSKWLFDILFEVEKRIEISNDPYKARVFGFMGEYLLNVYFNKHEEYKILRMDMLFVK